MSGPTIQVHADPSALADAVVAQLLARLVEVQRERGSASIVLTGGGVAAAVYAALASSPDRDAVDWRRVEVWWGDERFVPAGHPDRNDAQALAALAALPLDPARVHPMPASDGPDGDDADAAARRYAAALATAALDTVALGAAALDSAALGTAPSDTAAFETAGDLRLPRLDLVLLGVGEDGHIASVFPGHESSQATSPVTAVRDSPKPPPTRVTLTLSTINTADEVWLFAAGPEKAHAIGSALTGAGSAELPAAAVHGVGRTRWFLDQAAAADVPPSALR